MKPFHFSAFALNTASRLARPLLGALTLALVLQFFPAQPDGVYAQSPSQGRLQFDPLTSEERELAARLAEDNSRVKQLRGQARQRLISVELATVKAGPQSDRGVRHAEVLYYKYAGNRGILVLVDLENRAVREVMSISGDAVPLAAEEVGEAVTLALQNQTLINLLGADYQRYQVATQTLRAGEPNQVEALRLLASSPRDPCYQHRCVSLLFRQGETFLTGTSVIVDLTVQRARVERTARTRAPLRRRRT